MARRPTPGIRGRPDTIRVVRILTCVVLLGSLTSCFGGAGRRVPSVRQSTVQVGDGAQPAAGRRVVFVGDSITSGARPQIEGAATSHSYLPYVYAFPGLTSEQIDAALEKAQSDHPGAYATVLNAGTNDVHFDVGPSWKRSYDALLARAKTPCVVLTTVSERLDEQSHTPSARTINAYIRQVAGKHPHVRVVDWDSHVRSGAPVVLPDGVHPNDAGRRWIADQDLAALQRCDR